jgi:nucleoside-diphosphate-sugar epimerase
MRRLLIFGLGYSGAAIAREAGAAGFAVTATSREPERVGAPDDIELCQFEAAEARIAEATHIVITAPPGPQGDPVLKRYRVALAAAPHLRWVGYLSTTGVYGDRQGDWVDETSDIRAESPRAQRRAAAEQDWAQVLAGHTALDIFRVAGIYGPGRSVLDDLRAGQARRIIKPGHAFGRIHRDDIAGAVAAAMRQERRPGVRVLNLSDDQPEESAVVMAYAAGLLGMALPEAVAFADALPQMSEMARSFWMDNRRVRSRLTQQRLDYRWRYPSYREGLESILAEEFADNAAQQGQILRP